MNNDYHYPSTTVLRNRLGYTDPHTLAQAEALIAATRMAELAANPIDGHFDFAHLQAIHRHLLGELYEWAGELRTINTMPGNLGISHDPYNVVPAEAERIFGEISDGNYLRGRGRDSFTRGLAEHWGDLTAVHPFIDGNSRTQRVFFDQLAHEAGWSIEWRDLSVDAVQAARNFAYIDGGTILADVLAPVIKPVDEIRNSTVTTPPRAATMTLEEHWQAMLEHYDSMPEQTYTWSSQIKREAPQQNSADIAHRPEPKHADVELPELDVSKFHTQWTPDADYHHMTSQTIPQHGSRPEGPRL